MDITTGHRIKWLGLKSLIFCLINKIKTTKSGSLDFYAYIMLPFRKLFTGVYLPMSKRQKVAGLILPAVKSKKSNQFN